MTPSLPDSAPRLHIRLPRFPARRGCAGVLVLVAGVAASATAGEDCEWLPGQGLIGGDGLVRALHVFDDGRGPALYLAGDFSRFGSGRGAVARWNGESIEFVGETPFFPFAVNALTTYRGELYAGGTIGTQRFNDVWQPVGTGASPNALAFTVWNDQLIVGGIFNVAGDVVSPNVASWDGATWAALGDGLQGTVAALATHEGELFAGGFLTDFVDPSRGDAQSSGVARWTGEAWEVVGPALRSANALVSYHGALHVGTSGPIGVGADSSSVGFWDGVEWRPLGRVAGAVLALLADGGQLVAVGAISRADERFVRRATIWDGQKWNTMGGGLSGPGLAVARFEEEIVVGGAFLAAENRPVQRAARWDGASWRAIASGWSEAVSLGTYRGDLLVGGVLRTEQQEVFSGAIRLTANGPMRMGGPTQPWIASAFVERLGRLYAAVSFDATGEDRGVGVWDGVDWQRVGIDLSGDVRSLVFYRGELVAVGTFSVVGRPDARNVALFDGDDWTALGGGVDGPVDTAIVYRDELVVGGTFNSAGNAPAPRIAAWNGETWRPLASDPFGFLNRVSSLAEYRGELIAGGNFGSISELFTSNIAALGEGGWRPLGNGLVAADGGNVEALTVYDGRLIAGGVFSLSDFNAGGGDRGGNVTGVAAWNGQFWSLLEGAQTSGRVRSLLVHNGDLVAAGLTVDGTENFSAVLSRWSCPLQIGDVNCDGFINPGDIGAFVNALLDPALYRSSLPQCDILSADVNGDGTVNVGDIGAFVSLLVGT